MRIAHVITRMIVGGAQENTLLCCQDLIRDHGDEVLLVTGPSLGPEGDLLGEGRGERSPYSGSTPCGEPSIRGATGRPTARSCGSCETSGPTWSTRTARRGASSGGGRPRHCACRPSSTPCTVLPFILISTGWPGGSLSPASGRPPPNVTHLVSVADAMTGLLVAGGRGSAGEVQHRLQRHGCRAVPAGQ